MPVLARFETRSKIAVPVVSLPVPAVVGTAIRGCSSLRIGRPLPSGALTKSRNSFSGIVDLRVSPSLWKSCIEEWGKYYRDSRYTSSLVWQCQ